PYANAKVFSLDHMVRAASHDLVVMSDSDIRVSPRLLRALAAEFADPEVGVVTCPYRAVPGGSFWSRLEAVGLNTAFLGGVLAARMLEGMKFALGPTIAARRQVIEQLGGWEAFSPYLAEDFVLGQRAAAAGHKVLLSRYVIEHHIGSQPLGANFRHRVRWARSTRRSRPAGYIGQVFTNPLPLAIMLWISAPTWWPMSAAAVLARAAAAVATAGWVLGDPLTLRRPWLLPLEDLLSFAFWLAGFFGNTVTWRGRQYYLHRDGRFELIARETAARTHTA
ncbi:MAG: glycosyltransferase, partial [Acidobacteria bacterium]|nr:glycosyltransferase [Acidobacteriota bacterium]